MHIVSYDAQKPVADSYTALDEYSLPKYYRVFPWLFQELPDRSEQGGYDTEMKTYLILTDLLFNVRPDLRHQTLNYYPSSKEDRG